MSNLVFLTSYTLPFWVAVGLIFGAEYAWMSLANLYILHPIFDFLIEKFMPNKSNQNPSGQTDGKLSDNFSKAILLLYPVFQLVILATAMYQSINLELSSFEFITLAITSGIMTGGAGLTMAHELMHGKTNLPKFASLALMWMCSYPHWFIEHVLGHHKMVGTFEDPATSRRDETLYAFIPRSIIGQITSSYNLKTNLFTKLWLVQLAIYAGIILVAGSTGIIFFLVQSIVAIILLEHVNYIEHYGLERQKINGRYEKVTPSHSWDCYSFLTNVSMFNLGFHADHHAYINKEYTRLRSHEESNKMPYGFTVQMLMAMIPSLWFKTMNPILDAQKDDQKYFNKKLVPEIQTATFQTNFANLTTKVMNQNLFRYLKFTQILETEVINKLVGEIINKETSHPLLENMSFDRAINFINIAKEIFEEEEEHAETVCELIDDVKYRTRQRFQTLKRPSSLEKLLTELKTIKNDKNRSLTLFAFVFVSETLISNKLSLLAKDKEMYSPITKFMRHHLRDEVKHAQFFGEFFIELFASLNHNEQAYLLDKVEDYKALFLVPDMKAIYVELTNLGLLKEEALTIINEIESQFNEKTFEQECEATDKFIHAAKNLSKNLELVIS